MLIPQRRKINATVRGFAIHPIRQFDFVFFKRVIQSRIRGQRNKIIAQIDKRTHDKHTRKRHHRRRAQFGRRITRNGIHRQSGQQHYCGQRGKRAQKIWRFITQPSRQQRNANPHDQQKRARAFKKRRTRAHQRRNHHAKSEHQKHREYRVEQRSARQIANRRQVALNEPHLCHLYCILQHIAAETGIGRVGRNHRHLEEVRKKLFGIENKINFQRQQKHNRSHTAQHQPARIIPKTRAVLERKPRRQNNQRKRHKPRGRIRVQRQRQKKSRHKIIAPPPAVQRAPKIPVRNQRKRQHQNNAQAEPAEIQMPKRNHRQQRRNQCNARRVVQIFAEQIDERNRKQTDDCRCDLERKRRRTKHRNRGHQQIKKQRLFARVRRKENCKLSLQQTQHIKRVERLIKIKSGRQFVEAIKAQHNRDEHQRD